MSPTKPCVDGKIQLDKKHDVSILPQASSLLYHLHTLHLFTASDLKTFILPELIFGLSLTLSAPLTLILPHTLPLPSILLHRLPLTLLHLYLNTLLFTLSNQRLPSSITEDSLNKPTRPIPSHRITPTQTTRLLLFLIPLTLLITHYLITLGTPETLLLIILTWIYNDLNAANEHYLFRALINAVAHVVYSSASARVCSGADSLNTKGYIWLGIVGCIIFTTLQVQDLKDQEGDRARGRSTVPLVWGEGRGRWSVGVMVVVWSVVCLVFWGVGVLVGGLGGGVVRGLVGGRGRRCWVAWSWWVMGVFVLPVFAGGSGRF